MVSLISEGTASSLGPQRRMGVALGVSLLVGGGRGGGVESLSLLQEVVFSASVRLVDELGVVVVVFAWDHLFVVG